MTSACSTETDPDPTGSPDASASASPGTGEPSPTTDPSPTATRLPGGVLGDQARWVLAQLRPGASALTPGAARARFTSELLDELPAERLEATFSQLRGLGPFDVVEVAPATTQGDVRVLVVRIGGTEPMVMQVAVDDTDRIAGLFFQPDPEAQPSKDYDSLDEMAQDLAALGEAQVYVAEVTDDGCRTTYEAPADAGPAPSGSVFKLVVLTALAEAVADGDLDWDQRLTVTARLKSLPSGRLQDRPDGSRVTVREAADLMIGSSDNTATDVLVDALGRDRLQATVAALDLGDPSMDPMLTTREFFLLGWGAPEVREAWADAGPRRRRALLERLPKDLSAVPPDTVTTPVWDDGVGWYLTGEEVCRTYARLLDQATTESGAPLQNILGQGRGTDDGARGGTDASGRLLGYKGGSAPGVLALSYLVDTGSAGRQVLVVQLRSAEQVDEAAAAAAVEGGLAVLTEAPD